ncbi:Hypothetical_protein [Hexamita inflata]|uniref:Hypothetical_protein n=1 Tax=Hexamita inflata TaxID=28002 RepID=A0AA86U6D9_9EUKA|nr:Hypothetical protein HINF_LOCUS30419 [Hexamita inflata]
MSEGYISRDFTFFRGYRYTTELQRMYNSFSQVRCLKGHKLTKLHESNSNLVSLVKYCSEEMSICSFSLRFNTTKLTSALKTSVLLRSHLLKHRVVRPVICGSQAMLIFNLQRISSFSQKLYKELRTNQGWFLCAKCVQKQKMRTYISKCEHQFQFLKNILQFCHQMLYFELVLLIVILNIVNMLTLQPYEDTQKPYMLE